MNKQEFISLLNGPKSSHLSPATIESVIKEIEGAASFSCFGKGEKLGHDASSHYLVFSIRLERLKHQPERYFGLSETVESFMRANGRLRLFCADIDTGCLSIWHDQENVLVGCFLTRNTPKDFPWQ